MPHLDLVLHACCCVLSSALSYVAAYLALHLALVLHACCCVLMIIMGLLPYFSFRLTIQVSCMRTHSYVHPRTHTYILKQSCTLPRYTTISRTYSMKASAPSWPWCTAVSPPTPSLAGTAHSPCACWATTVCFCGFVCVCVVYAA